MTSPSLKNHPTTPQLNPTRSNAKSLWKQLLAGALCLAVGGSLTANDREVGKPLDRLKQRSARQRWREMRGEWVPAPELKSDRPAPFSSPYPAAKPAENQAAPIPTEAPEIGAIPIPSEEPAVAPVPEPMEASPEEDVPEAANPGAKPASDPDGPLPHPGSMPESGAAAQPESFRDVVLEPRSSSPRDRSQPNLPHWPFRDDADRIMTEPGSDPLAESAEPAPPSAPAMPAEGAIVTEAATSPIQVAEVPGNGQPDAPAAEVTPTPAPAEANPAPAQEPAEAAPAVAHASRPLPKLRSIREIRPFSDYHPEAETKLEAMKNQKMEMLQVQGSLDRNPATTAVYWQASNVTHNPLYFEDPGLERSGHAFSDAVQPFVSVGKFGAQIVALPYSIALDPVWKHETPLGHYRPGECAPKRHLALPLNREAAATAAAAYTGIIFLIP